MPIITSSSAYAIHCVNLLKSVPPGFVVVALIAISKAKLKRVVETASPCLTPFCVSNSSEHVPCITTLPLVLVKDSFIKFINFLGIPKLYNALYNSFLLILSKACLKSINTQRISISYCNEFAGFYFTMEVYYTQNSIHNRSQRF
jgi:hypothetical protein